MPWEHKDRLFVQVQVDEESMLGKIAEARCKMEELERILKGLQDAISFEEKATDPTSESVADEAAEKLAEKLSNISSHI